MPHYVCALPNKKGTAYPEELVSNDPTEIEAFAQKHNKPGWGVFDCHNPLKEGAIKRNKETVAAVTNIYVDVDVKNITETKERALAIC
jgi:hypothetical protein